MGKTTKRIGIYCRVSTDEQAEHGHSLKEQESRLRKWVKDEDHDLADVFIDEGHSGTTDRRPELQNLMHSAESGQLDAIAVTKLDRFMRNEELQYAYLRRLREANVDFVVLDMLGIDYNTSVGMAQMGMNTIFAAWYSRRIGDSVREARAHLKAKGYHNGGRPSYGYTWNKDTKKYEIVVQEVAVLMRIFDLYVNQNMGTLAVAKKLNQEGFTPKQRKNNKHGWSDGRIYRILTNKQYIGQDNDYNYPAIIDESLFIRAQEKMRLAKKIQRNPVGHLLQGYVFCPECGTRLNIIGTRNRAYFHCKGNNKQGCSAKSIRENWLQEKVIDQLHDMVNSPSLLKQCVENRLATVKDELARLESIVEPQKKQIQRIEEKKQRLNYSFEIGGIGKAEYTEKIQQCQRELNELLVSRQEVDMAIQRQYEWQGESVKLMQKMLDNIDGKSAKIWASFQLMNDDDIRQFLCDFQIQVIVLNDHVEIKGLIPEDVVNTECKQVIGSGS